MGEVDPDQILCRAIIDNIEYFVKKKTHAKS